MCIYIIYKHYTYGAIGHFICSYTRLKTKKRPCSFTKGKYRTPKTRATSSSIKKGQSHYYWHSLSRCCGYRPHLWSQSRTERPRPFLQSYTYTKNGFLRYIKHKLLHG